MTNNTAFEVMEALKSANNVLLSLHISPDGDSLASCQAFSRVLQQLNIKHTVVSPEPTPAFLDKLIDQKNILRNDISEMDLSEYDVYLSLDVLYPSRCSNNDEFKIPPHMKTINIDHHPANEPWADINFVNTSAAATCCILYDLFTQAQVEIDPTTAKYLFVGIYTDTGSLQNSNTNSAAVSTVSKLMELGANLYEIIWTMKYNEEIDSIKYKSIVYKNTVLNAEKRYAYSTITLDEMEAIGIKSEEKMSTASDLIKYIRDVDFVFVIKEKVDALDGSKLFSVSFRAHKIGYDVSNLASMLGGGGHKPAAAALLRDSNNMEEALKFVINTLQL